MWVGVYVCVGGCVCERERGRDRERPCFKNKFIQFVREEGGGCNNDTNAETRPGLNIYNVLGAVVPIGHMTHA